MSSKGSTLVIAQCKTPPVSFASFLFSDIYLKYLI